jgi:hypothetical protein
MTNPDRLSQGEVIAARYISETGITFGDGTVQDSSAADGLGAIVRWTPSFTATGLTFTGSGITHPAYNSYYAKVARVVTFSIEIDMTTVTNFGTGQFKTSLPFPPYDGTANHFSGWVWVDPSLPVDELNGHIILVADHLPGSQTLDIHWHKQTTASPKPVIESLFVQGTPVTLITASKMWFNGTYMTAE